MAEVETSRDKVVVDIQSNGALRVHVNKHVWGLGLNDFGWRCPKSGGHETAGMRCGCQCRVFYEPVTSRRVICNLYMLT